MAAKLSILVPVDITPAMLTGSSIAEADYEVWNSTAIYGLGVRCIKNHRIYESQVAADAASKNQGKDPADLITQFGTIVYWNDVGPTNRWAMFDNEVSSQSTATTGMTVVIKPGAFNSIYLGGMEAVHLDITIKAAPGGAVIYTYSGALEASRPTNYYDWYFFPFSFLRSKLLSGIPAYSNMELTVTITSGAGATVKCGVLAVGLLQVLGRTQQGAKAKPKNFGYVKVDDYGKATVKKGKAATDVTASALIENREARQVQEILESAIGGACMLSCSDNADYSGLIRWGLLSGEVVYKTSSTSEVNVSLEGII